jgi:thymidylate synthase
MKFKTVTDAFESLYNNIVLDEGELFSGTKAVFNASFTVEDVKQKVVTTPERNFKEEYAEYEWNWYLKGDRDASEISEKAKIWKNMYVGDTTEVNSNYGYFWNYNNQLSRVIADLKKNKDTRRAIIVHYDINELERYKYDTPCNDVLNCYVKEGKLYLTVFARSIDLWFGFCNDFYTFAKLMELVSKETGYEVGSMHWMITNLHVYERHWDKKLKL